jgi:hypothetical protein
VVFWFVMLCSLIDGYQRFVLVYTLKIQAILSSEILVTTYKTTRRRNTEDHNLQFHPREDLTYHKFSFPFDMFQSHYTEASVDIHITIL